MANIYKKLPPKLKRIIVLCCTGAFVVGFIVLGLKFGERTAYRTHQEEIVKNVLMDRSTREVSIDAMEADLKRLSRENKELSQQISVLQNQIDRQAYSSGLKIDPSLLENKLRDMNQKLQDLDELYKYISKKIDYKKNSWPQFESQLPQNYDNEINNSKNDADRNERISQENLHSNELSTDYEKSSDLYLDNHNHKPSKITILREDLDKNNNQNFNDSKSNSRIDQNSDKEIVLPAGSILSGVILNGMDAPTGHGTGHQQFPALVRIQKEAILPNNYKADIRECFLIVSGYGDLSSQRAYLRGEILSCISSRKEIFEGRLDSYVVGSDGHAGVRGRLVSKQGQIIAKSLMAGFLSGLSKAFDVNAVPTINTSSSGTVSYEKVYSSSAFQGAAASGISSSMERIANFYIEMAEGIFPVIEIDAGRMVNIIVSRGTHLKVTRGSLDRSSDNRNVSKEGSKDSSIKDDQNHTSNYFSFTNKELKSDI